MPLDDERLEHSSGVSTKSKCLSEDDVLALCEGRATKEALPRIDEHIDQCDNCRQWVVEMLGFAEVEIAKAGAEVDPDADPDTLHPTILRSGSIIAERFRIIRFIKRGGMGEVYEAFDQMLEAPVALKTIISTACDSPKAIRKLKAEVQLARSIRHPNVCSVFDFWEHRENDENRSPTFFFTMEFIDGETLGQRLRRGRIELAEVRRLARLQLLGLRAAHVSGVVHRDFKSDNVMLRRDGKSRSDVVVMDFGLARVVPTEGGSMSNDSEQFAGSVAYMAPEQVEGRKHIGTEADVFAFGVVLFEMLTGQLPFNGDSPWTIATRRLTERPPPPSRLAPGVSPALDAFVLRCMGRQPTDRFKDAQAALEAFEQLEPAPLVKPKWGKAVAASAVTFMTCAAVASLWSMRGNDAERSGPARATETRERAPLQPATKKEPPSEAASPTPQAPVLGTVVDPVSVAAPKNSDVEPSTSAAAITTPATNRTAPQVKPGRPRGAAEGGSGAPLESAKKTGGLAANVEEVALPGARTEMASASTGASNAASPALSDASPGSLNADDAKKRKPGAPARLRGFE